jgi:hypothetical protein
MVPHPGMKNLVPSRPPLNSSTRAAGDRAVNAGVAVGAIAR